MIAEQYTGKLRKGWVVSSAGLASLTNNHQSPCLPEKQSSCPPQLRSRAYISVREPISEPSDVLHNVKTGFYAAINFGSCGAISASFVARDHGYWVDWLIPTGIFCLVPLALLVGKKNYVITPPRGSILLEVCGHASNVIEWY